MDRVSPAREENGDGNEPCLKKARVDDGASPNEVARDAAICAGDVLELVLEKENGDVTATFAPTFTHQFFDDERVPAGYKDPKIRICVNGESMTYRVEMTYEREPDGEDGAADLVAVLRPAVPAGSQFVVNGTELPRMIEATTSKVPPGREVMSYKRDGHDGQEHEFVVYHATPTDEGCVTYHLRAQKLAPWFIEGGDDVDPSEDTWDLIYLYERLDEGRLQISGYFTLYAFHNPVKGKSLRVCQALILPAYQRQGHGQKLLRYVYDMARSQDVVHEVTVEDPAPGFSMLRNVTDVQDFADAVRHDQGLLPAACREPGSFQALSKGDVPKLHQRLKITKEQIYLAYECFKLVQVEDGNQDHEKSFRLMVKRRLWNQNCSQYVSDKDALQKHVAREFEDRLAVCKDILQRAKL